MLSNYHSQSSASAKLSADHDCPEKASTAFIGVAILCSAFWPNDFWWLAKSNVINIEDVEHLTSLEP